MGQGIAHSPLPPEVPACGAEGAWSPSLLPPLPAAAEMHPSGHRETDPMSHETLEQAAAALEPPREFRTPGFWVVCNRRELEAAKERCRRELAKTIYAIFDEVGPPCSPAPAGRPRSLAMRELLRVC